MYQIQCRPFKINPHVDLHEIDALNGIGLHCLSLSLSILLGRDLGRDYVFLGEAHEAEGIGILALSRGEVGEKIFCHGSLETEKLKGFDRAKILGDCEVEELCNGLFRGGWPVEWVRDESEAFRIEWRYLIRM